MEKLTLEQLVGYNHDYQHNFGVTEKELEIASGHIAVVELRHHNITSPQVGDMVCGSYYHGSSVYDCGLISKVENGVAEVCYHPYVPFVCSDFAEIRLSVSGGPFTHSHICMFEKVEEDVERMFTDWGRFGPGGSQAFNFPVIVRKWKLVEPIQLVRDDWGDNTITYDIEGSEFFSKVKIPFASKKGDKITVWKKDGSQFEAKHLGSSTKATIEYLEAKEKGVVK